MPFGSGFSGFGLAPGPENGVLRTDPASGVTVVSGLSDPGTSILVLDSVGNDHEGFYSCEARYSDETVLTSSPAVLVYSGESFNFSLSSTSSICFLISFFFFAGTSVGSENTIILPPPDQLTVTEGDPVTIPCVGSNQATPSFTTPAGLVAGPFSFDIASITTSQGGEYRCQVELTMASVTVMVIPRSGMFALCLSLVYVCVSVCVCLCVCVCVCVCVQVRW